MKNCSLDLSLTHRTRAYLGTLQVWWMVALHSQALAWPCLLLEHAAGPVLLRCRALPRPPTTWPLPLDTLPYTLPRPTRMGSTAKCQVRRVNQVKLAQCIWVTEGTLILLVHATVQLLLFC